MTFSAVVSEPVDDAREDDEVVFELRMSIRSLALGLASRGREGTADASRIERHASAPAGSGPEWTASARCLPTVDLVLAGELDVAVAHNVLDAIPALQEGTRVVVDLAGLTFIDVAGLRALARMQEAVQAKGGRFTLAGVGHVPLRVMRVIGADALLGVVGQPGASEPPAR